MRQQTILLDVWDALKPGGFLLYSTCTFNTEENEANVRWLSQTLGADVLPIPTDPTWEIRGTCTKDEMPVYRCSLE